MSPKTQEISKISLKIAENLRNIAESLQKIFADKRTHPNAEKPMGAAVSRSELNNDNHMGTEINPVAKVGRGNPKLILVDQESSWLHE